MVSRTYLDSKNLVLLTYDPRSGSTYLATRLDDFEDISVSVETYFLQNLIDLHADELQEPEKVIAALHAKDFRFKNIMRHPQYFYEFYSEYRNITHYDFAKCILSAYFTDQDPARTWIIKCGIAGWHVFNILKKMPRFKFIHILRDGRGVLNSKLTTQRAYSSGTMSQEPLTPALKWRSWIQHIDSFREAFPHTICEVKYEDLLINTDADISRLRAFLGLEPPRQNNLGQERIQYKEKIPETEKSLHVHVDDGPVTNNIHKWQSNLKKGDIMLFEYLTAEMLVHKGYEPIYIKNHALPWKHIVFWFSLTAALLKYGYRKGTRLLARATGYINQIRPAKSE